ncbi:MAG TPA: hypothetical protein VN622_02525 [Clostridia bacterium]|nr:hypothetical protein [Clostridia bacterium]
MDEVKVDGKDARTDLAASADRLASASEALEKVLTKIDAQYESLNAKVDRIIATIDEAIAPRQGVEASSDMREKVARLEKENTELQAQAQRAMRKTLAPTVSVLLAKSGVEGLQLEEAVLDKALAALSVEQRIAVKAEMARAGMIG